MTTDMMHPRAFVKRSVVSDTLRKMIFWALNI